MVDEFKNLRNSRILAPNQLDVPASVMVFPDVASDGNVIPLYFIRTGLKINTDKYMKSMSSLFRTLHLLMEQKAFQTF